MIKTCITILLAAVSACLYAQSERMVEMKPTTQSHNFERRGVSLKEALNQITPTPLNVKKEQTGTLIVAVLLPFKAESSKAILDAVAEMKENRHRAKLLTDEAKTALEFYDGAMLALKKIQNSEHQQLKMELHFFDTWGNDSVINELLKEKAIKNANVIIGPATHEGAKKIAEFCKQNSIVNVQPFSPSKSITTSNPYHVKLAPTLEAHIDNMVRSLADSFMQENIVIYTTSNKSDLQAAQRLDSILRNFDGAGKTRFNITFFNTATAIKSEKKSVVDVLHPTKKNIVVACAFEEPNAQMVIRQLAAAKPQVIVYGMPTWLNSEVLRLDYLNKLNARFTEQFVEDTLDNKKAMEFINLYREINFSFPPKYAWLGYDVINWLYNAAEENDRFPANIQGSFYSGAGYKFQFRIAERTPKTTEKRGIDYYENTFLHLLRIQNYTLLKDW
ncbi:MAG: amino acid ABC transporter substrate-binding protein [Chitinophagales bacterium]|nr:amino acid ABC transporter substrate-binding protein [Chitinophagales bacterium]